MELAEELKIDAFEEGLDLSQSSPSCLRNRPYHYVIGKRIFDICFALLLLPFLLPLIGIISILIKLDSKGPVFFSHKRVGKGGRPFICYKFRTMVKNAELLLDEILENNLAQEEWKKDFKLREDPRVTKIGKRLRKLSLDELPQIFNVLKGEMSFVGPRPIIKDEIRKYGEEINSYYSVHPGITGLWQVNGRNDVDYSKRVTLDKQYIDCNSLVLDLKIIFKTLPVIFFQKGAY